MLEPIDDELCLRTDDVAFYRASHGDVGRDANICPVRLAGVLLVDVGAVRLSVRGAHLAWTALSQEPLVRMGRRFRGAQKRGRGPGKRSWVVDGDVDVHRRTPATREDGRGLRTAYGVGRPCQRSVKYDNMIKRAYFVYCGTQCTCITMLWNWISMFYKWNSFICGAGLGNEGRVARSGVTPSANEANPGLGH